MHVLVVKLVSLLWYVFCWSLWNFFIAGLLLFSFNPIVWWVIFILSSLSMLPVSKMSGEMEHNVLYYVLWQELFSLLFVVFCYYSYYWGQVIVMMFKSGVTPLNGWLMKGLYGLEDWSYLMVLTVMKLPYLVSLILLFNNTLMFIIVIFFFGMMFFILNRGGWLNLMVNMSSEMCLWVVLCGVVSRNLALFLVSYYLLFMLLFYPILGNSNNLFVDVAVVFMLMNLPFMLSFFFKVMVLGSLSFPYGAGFVIMLLFSTGTFLVMYIFGLVSWGVSLKSDVFNKHIVYWFLVLPISFFFIV